MGYTLGSGIKFAVLTSGLVISGIASPSLMAIQSEAAAQKASIIVNISGLRNSKGHILVCLTSNKKEYPDCRKDANARKKKIAAVNNSTVVFENVDPGIYALALVHDKNSNDKMDIALFLPKEGFGMSNNPKVRMGKPKFKNSQFTVGNANVVKNITMKYIL